MNAKLAFNANDVTDVTSFEQPPGMGYPPGHWHVNVAAGLSAVTFFGTRAELLELVQRLSAEVYGLPVVEAVAS